MENRKYKVSRDSVYVGTVVRTDKVYRYEGDTALFRTKSGQLATESWFSYRSMLFIPNEEKLANDLLYQSPHYPILNVTEDETCLGLGEKSIVIQDACNLAALLEYFGYSKNLTFEEIKKIRNTFFTGRFAMDNCELFGYKEIKRGIAEERKLQQAENRSFEGVKESVLPNEYFDVLDKMGDNNIMDAIKWHEKVNAFAPPIQEGLIKKLKRF